MSARRAAPGSTKREIGIEAQLAALKVRRQQFLELHDFTVGRGLEVGPLDSAITDRRSDDVRYVDVFDQEGTRRQYAHDEQVITELIPEIDYSLESDGVIRALSDAVAPGAPYDWVLASHVLEHVPDLIGWLQDVARITTEDGVLVLALPDRRYTFDRHRPPTTTGQALEAHEERHSRPTVRAVYDYVRSAVFVDTVALWNGSRPPGRDAAMFDRDDLDAALARVRAGDYVDAHVWTFTPHSFVSQLVELRELDLCGWFVDKLVTPAGAVEFYAVLGRRTTGSARDGGLSPVESGVDADLPDWLLAEWSLSARVRELEERVDKLRRRNRRLRRRLDRLTDTESPSVARSAGKAFDGLRRRISRAR